MYRQRDEATENTLNFQIEQEQKYQDLVKQYHALESDWKNLEAYVKSLHEFQKHVENKYGMLLEEYQQLIAELPDEDTARIHIEKEENLVNMVKAKDEEIQILKEDKQKKEHIINALRTKETQIQNLMDENDKLQEVVRQTSQLKDQYEELIREKENRMNELKKQVKAEQDQSLKKDQQV